jgi:hypothetical protein
MASTALSAGGIALHGAPDTDLASKDAKQHAQLHAMQIDMTQDVLDQLLDTMNSGKLPQLYFGRTPVRTQTRSPASFCRYLITPLSLGVVLVLVVVVVVVRNGKLGQP